eukprot:snap_masked-scaffold_4-processed-gene-15.17-mRNA-1 protein AED:1.00 eAED:1.00 QI:0/0/0/0/1/1/2/0/71
MSLIATQVLTWKVSSSWLFLSERKSMSGIKYSGCRKRLQQLVKQATNQNGGSDSIVYKMVAKIGSVQNDGT